MNVIVALRDVEDTDIDRLVEMNRLAVPAVNEITAEEFRWFKDHASYFRVAEEEQKRSLLGFLIALEPGLPYASANYRWFCTQYDAFVYVDRVVIDEAARGTGTGSQLYADLTVWATPDIPRITCEVNKRPPNPVSLGFHHKHGFVEVGEQDTEGGKKTVALLSREL